MSARLDIAHKRSASAPADEAAMPAGQTNLLGLSRAEMGEALADEPDRCAQLAALGSRILVVHGVDDDAWPGPVQGPPGPRSDPSPWPDGPRGKTRIFEADSDRAGAVRRRAAGGPRT